LPAQSAGKEIIQPQKTNGQLQINWNSENIAGSAELTRYTKRPNKSTYSALFNRLGWVWFYKIGNAGQ
jgi:hypothetical protein